MKRYEKIVLEAENGITFEVSEETSGVLVIRAKEIDYSTNYSDPPIPAGYTHILGEWDTGYVIKRVSDGSEFVWVPVGCLDPTGTVGGFYNEKFGRRNYMDNIFSEKNFNESMDNDEQLLRQMASIRRYGGFYISRYNISKSKDGRPQSLKGVMPWVNISYIEAMKVSLTFENKEEVTSHLTYGAEYDTILAWLIKTRVMSLMEVTEKSTKFGNFIDNENSQGMVVSTGTRSEWITNNIYDLCGNVSEWTQERKGESGETRVIRGGYCRDKGTDHPVACRYYNYANRAYEVVGFRVALYIK